ncbi:hypothetical protein C7I55_11500 [Sphingomonas deserti]|uniref:Autotransporter domain-containing protein n=1 Tax=Allosphingosinicella deserti TaxID=2116704 RepID=A0A2P7QSE8_9SPHN|nr:hypothetical protein C7I55_11500 [Sphingomonas deserti]
MVILKSQASRLALRSGLGVAVAAGATLLAPEAAWANCGVAGNAVVCGTTATTDTIYPANSPNDRAYGGASAAPLTLTVNAGAEVSGHGLAITNSGSGGVSVINDGVIGIDSGNVASAGGTGALSISANGGAISYVGDGNIAHNENLMSGPAFTAAQTGGVGSIAIDIGGSVYAGNGDGVAVEDVTSSTGITIVTNDVDASQDGREGISVRSDSFTGDVSVTANGSIQAGGAGISALLLQATAAGDIDIHTNGSVSAHQGIFANNQGSGSVTVTANGPIDTVNYGVGVFSNGGDITIHTGDVTSTTTEGVIAQQTSAAGAGAVRVITGDVSAASTGIIAENDGSGVVSVTANGTVTAGTLEGIRAFGHSDVIVTIANEVRGATAGLALTGGIDGAGEIAVSGPGGFRGGTGDAANINNLGAGSVRFAIGGPSSSLGGNGIYVRDTAIGGDIGVTTGAVTTSTIGREAIDVRTASTAADIAITANGDIQSSGTGIRATTADNTATGAIEILANGAVSGLTGISARNFGTGTIFVNAIGPITTTEGAGIYAQTSGGSIAVYAGTVVSTGNQAVSAWQLQGGATGTVEVSANDVSGTLGLLASTAGTGDVRVYANGTTTGTVDEGILASGGGAVSVFVADRVTGGSSGMRLKGGDGGTGDIAVIGTGAFVGQNGDAAYLLNNGAGTVTLDISGASSAVGGHGIYIRDTVLGGDIRVETGAVSALSAGSNAIDVQTLSTTANLSLTAEDDVQAGGVGMLAVIGAGGTGNMDIVANQSVSGTEGISALNFGTGTIFVSAAGPVSATTGEGVYAQSSGGNIAVYAADVISTGNTGVAGQQIQGGSTATVELSANDVSGTTGFLASNAGSGEVRIYSNGRTTGTLTEGIRASAGGAMTVFVADRVTGATNGMTLSGGAEGGGNIAVVGTGEFVALNGHAASILNGGVGDVTVDISGASSALGGSGIVVRDTVLGGDVSVTTGAVNAPDADGVGIDVQLDSTSADLTIVAEADIHGGNAGVAAGLQSNAATGDIDVTTQAAISGRYGIEAYNLGSGSTTVTAIGPVSADGAYGVSARTNAGNVIVSTGDVTSTDLAVVARQVSAGAAGVVDVTVRNVLGTQGILADNNGASGVTVRASGTVTGTSLEGIRATGNDAVTIAAAQTVTGATSGLLLVGGSGGAGDISVTGTGGFVGGTGDGANILNEGAGTVTVDISGASSSVGGHGITVADTASGGDVGVTTGAVTALDADGIAVDVRLDSISADIAIVSNGDVQGGNAGVVAGLSADAAGGHIDVTTNGAVSGRYGIEAYNLGSGSVTVTAIGPVSADGAYGVSARTNAGNVIVSTGDVTSTNLAVVARQVSAGAAGMVDVTVRNVLGTQGILADNNGASGVTVRASGTVTGTSLEGIRATGNDAVTIAAAQTVTGASSGLLLVGGSGGAGDISVTGTGGFVGGSGDGANILNEGAGTVTVDISGAGGSAGANGIVVRNSATGGDIGVRTGAITALAASANAIDVQSQSTAADITIAAHGDLQAGLAGVVARIAPDAATGDIAVTGQGLIAGEFGIVAGNAGSGSVAVVANRAITATDLGILAVANGGNIAVTAADDVRSTGASAIIAQNSLVAPNVGTINVAVNAGSTITADSADAAGIRTTIGGSSGTTTINLDGTINAGAVGISSNSISGAIITNIGASGVIDPLIGIDQTSISGAINVNNAGSVEGDLIGVRLGSTGAGAVGPITVNQIGTGRINGIAEQGLLLTGNDAAITITGNGANSSISGGTIAVQAVNSGTGAIAIAGNSIFGRTGGIAAQSTGVNNGIAVTGAGTIATTSGIGVLLRIDNAASAGDLIVDRSGSISGEVGVLAQTNGTGDITVRTGGNVTASNGPAIVARNVGAAANAGSIGITIGAGTRVTAAGGSGVVTESGLSTGATTIDVAGKIMATGAGNAGVRGSSSAGAITVNIGSAGSLDPDFGVDLATVNGALAVNNAGLISGTVAGVRLVATGSGTAMVNNNGTISGANAIAGSLSGGIFTLNNTGMLNGAINVAGSNLATSTMTNAPAALANVGSGSSSFSGSLVNSGAVNIGPGGTMSFLRNSSNSGRITFTGAGSFTTDGAMSNSGIINAHNNLTSNVVTVGGNYTGGGQFFADYSTTSSAADRLNIGGTAAGTTNVTLNRVGARSFVAGGFLPVVSVAQGAAADAFTSSSPFAQTGFVLEGFGRNPANPTQFGLVQAINPSSLSLGSLSFVAEAASSLLDAPISPYVTARTGRPANDKRVSLWMRASGGHTDQVIAASLAGGGVSIDTSDRIRVVHEAMQIGADVNVLNLGDGGWNLHLGVVGGWYDGDARLSAADRVSVETPFVGAYVAAGNGALSLEATIRKEWRNYDLAMPTMFSAGSEEVDGSATAASFHASYRIGAANGFAATPFVGFLYASSDIDDLAIDADSRYFAESDKTRIGEAGLRLSYRRDIAESYVIEPFASASLVKNWSRRAQGRFSFGQPAETFSLESVNWNRTMRYSAGIMGHARGGRVSAFVVGNLEDGSSRRGFTVNGGLRFNF